MMPPGPRSTSSEWHLDSSNRLARIHQRYRQTDRQHRQDNGRVAQSELLLVTVAQKSVISIRVRTRYMDKNNGDGVETKNSFTLGVIEVAVPGLEEATSGLTKLLPVERQPLQV